MISLKCGMFVSFILQYPLACDARPPAVHTDPRRLLPTLPVCRSTDSLKKINKVHETRIRINPLQGTQGKDCVPGICRHTSLRARRAPRGRLLSSCPAPASCLPHSYLYSLLLPRLNLPAVVVEEVLRNRVANPLLNAIARARVFCSAFPMCVPSLSWQMLRWL